MITRLCAEWWCRYVYENAWLMAAMACVSTSWHAFPLNVIFIDVVHMSHSANTLAIEQTPSAIHRHRPYLNIVKRYVVLYKFEMWNGTEHRPIEIAFAHSRRNLIRFYWLSSRRLPFSDNFYELTIFWIECVCVLVRLSFSSQIEWMESIRYQRWRGKRKYSFYSRSFSNPSKLLILSFSPVRAHSASILWYEWKRRKRKIIIDKVFRNHFQMFNRQSSPFIFSIVRFIYARKKRRETNAT